MPRKGNLIGGLPFKVKDAIANDVNNTDVLEIALESITIATVKNTSPADLNETTETLVRLAEARAGVANAVVSEREFSVRAFRLCFLIAYLKPVSFSLSAFLRF